jgi:hypothetical protein
MARAVAKAEKQLDLATQSEPVSESGMWLAMFDKIARDPTIDIARLREVMNMRNEIEDRAAQRALELEDRAAKRAFNLSFAAAQAEMMPIARNLRNDQTHSNYADLSAIADAITPIITKHGFGTSFGTLPCTEPGYILMYCDLTHGGFEKRYESLIPLDDKGPQGKVNKTQVHAFGSTTSYGRRYLKVMIFDIATKDTDGNVPKGKTWDTISEDQQTQLRDLLAETNTPVEKFLATGNPPPKSLADIPADQFEAAVTMLEGRREKMRAKAKEAATNV